MNNHDGAVRITLDVTEPGRGIGYTEDSARQSEDLLFSRGSDGPGWTIYGGDQDEYRGYGSSLKIAAKRLAKAMGYQRGTLIVCFEYRGNFTTTSTF